MLNVELALPMTPHGAFNLLEDADVCWVIVPFNTDEDEIDEIHAFLVGMTQYFNGRCSVASLDMAYPGNQRTFGGVVDDYPMLLVREANRPGFFKKPIEKGHFEAKDPSDWGYKITSEQIETNLRGSLERVVDKVYEPMSQFQKYHVLYQVWHRSDAAAYFHQRVINDLLKENLGEVDERMSPNDVAVTARKWLESNIPKITEKMKTLGLRTEPAPLPGDLFFKKLNEQVRHDEL